MSRIQLFCLPYAGGTASFFDELAEKLAGTAETYAFEYAGHGTRLSEPFYEDFTQLAQDAAAFINARLEDDSVFLLFGYSMGTIGLYELLADGLLRRQPQQVLLASHEAPDETWDSKRYLTMSDGEFLAAMKQFGGFDNVSEKMLNNRFFRRMHFAPIREDYRLLGNYPENRRYHFSMPVTMMYAEQDIPSARIHGWDRFFAADSTYITMGENHFFLKDCAEQVAEIVRKAANTE